MISIVSKSAIVRGERGPRFAAEAVLLPRGLTLLAAHNGALGGSSTSAQRSGFETGSDTISFGFRVPPNPPSRRRNPHQNPLLPKPHSGLVQSYYRAVANEMRETSGPPWLVPRAETTHGSVTPSDGCLFTPAWERRHRPVHTALTRPLGRCTGVPNQAAPRGASSRDRGTVSPERDGKGLLLPGAVLGVIPNPVSANRAWSNPPDGLAVRTGDQSSGPCPGNGATGQSRKSNTWSGHGAPGLGNRTVIGAAAAVRLADVRSPKRPKVSGTGVPVERAESAECLVYKRNLGATGRADQKLERDSPMSAVLEERAPIGRSGFAADSEARVLLTCAGEAALLHDVSLFPAKSLDSVVPTL